MELSANSVPMKTLNNKKSRFGQNSTHLKI